MLPVRKFLVKSGNNSFYCKVSPFQNYNSNSTSTPTVRATISFGGNDQYCLVIALPDITKDHGYIDRVEYNKACVKDGSLTPREGMQQFVSTCLYTMTRLFPNIKNLNLKDDSRIYCQEGSKTHKLSLAHDYILKYNQTYYEKKYIAQLPPPLYEKYKESLNVLDAPLDPYEFQVQRFPQLLPYQEIYTSSSSPRMFLQALRTAYNDQYCFEVGPWLHKYMDMLQIKIYEDDWFIMPHNLGKPTNYTIRKTTNRLRGGSKTVKKRPPQNFTVASYKPMGFSEP